MGGGEDGNLFGTTAHSLWGTVLVTANGVGLQRAIPAHNSWCNRVWRGVRMGRKALNHMGYDVNGDHISV